VTNFSFFALPLHLVAHYPLNIKANHEIFILSCFSGYFLSTNWPVCFYWDQLFRVTRIFGKGTDNNSSKLSLNLNSDQLLRSGKKPHLRSRDNRALSKHSVHQIAVSMAMRNHERWCQRVCEETAGNWAYGEWRMRKSFCWQHFANTRRSGRRLGKATAKNIGKSGEMLWIMKKKI